MALKGRTQLSLCAALALMLPCFAQAQPPAANTPQVYADATTDGPGGGACQVNLRIVAAGSWTPITTGFQVAVDPSVDVNHPAAYQIGASSDGQATFSGGGLHEVAERKPNGAAPLGRVEESFDVELVFVGGASASALIHRNCHGATGHLVYIMPDATTGQGGEWKWVEWQQPQ